MSFIGAALGGGGGSSANFSAQAAPIQTAVTPEMLRYAQQQAQQGIGQQSDIVNLLSNQTGINKESDVYGQQQALAQQLQQNALGQGPNPAQAQLAQATAANTANQAALMAGQRGAGANAGLIGRQAAMQGAANQQQSAGQAATLGAQQQLAAQAQLGQQQQAMGNTAGNLAQQYLGAQAGYNQLGQNQQGNFFNAIGQMNNANVSNAAQMNNQNGAMAQQNSGFNQGIASGLVGGLGAAGMQAFMSPSKSPGRGTGISGFAPGAGMMLAAEGGEVPNFSNVPNSNTKLHPNVSAGRSMLSQHLAAVGSLNNTHKEPELMRGAGAGDNMSSRVMAASKGGHVPGQAKVKGDSYANDNVPAMLSPGEVVIPRRIMQGPDAANKSARFVAAILAKNGRAK